MIRDRGVRMRGIGALLASRFREAQVGSLRPGLTLEDGTLVVTDNYLKVRVPRGRARNERVAVRNRSIGRRARGDDRLRNVCALGVSSPGRHDSSTVLTCAPGERRAAHLLSSRLPSCPPKPSKNRSPR